MIKKGTPNWGKPHWGCGQIWCCSCEYYYRCNRQDKDELETIADIVTRQRNLKK